MNLRFVRLALAASKTSSVSESLITIIGVEERLGTLTAFPFPFASRVELLKGDGDEEA